MLWLPGQGRLISQAADQSFALWELNEAEGKGTVLERVGSVATADRLKAITAVALRRTAEDGVAGYSVLIGTESGNIYALQTPSLALSDYIIYQDVVIQK